MSIYVPGIIRNVRVRPSLCPSVAAQELGGIGWAVALKMNRHPYSLQVLYLFSVSITHFLY